MGNFFFEDKKVIYGDFIVDLFKKGFYHVVEKIIMELPLKSIRSCQQVSQDWFNIVQHFQSSTVPRILKLKDIRIDEEWKNANYTLQSKELEDKYFKSMNHKFSCKSLTADDKNIVISAVVDPSLLRVIVVYDTKDLTANKVLPSQEDRTRLPIMNECAAIYIQLDEKYLYAVVGNRSEIKILVWNRMDYFKLFFIKDISTEYKIGGIASHLIANIPYVHNGLLHLRDSSNSSLKKLSLDVWNVEKNSKEKMEKTFPSENYFLLKDGSGNFFTKDSNVLSFYAGNVQQWSRAKPNRQPILLGSDKSYAAFTWESLDSNKRPRDLVEIYCLAGGALALKFKALFGIQKRAIFKFDSNKMAFSVPTSSARQKNHSTVIFDLKMKRKISNLKGLGLVSVTHIELAKDKIIFVQGGNLHCAKFWL